MAYNYPKHQWTKYIDNQFSYSNKVNNSNIKALENVECNQVSLEPRLQEYMKKKKLYKDNNIATDIPLEQTYQITKDDIRILRAFFTGRKDMYDQGNAEFNELNRVKENKKQFFESKSYRDNDPRVLKPKNNSANQYAKNCGMFVPDEGGSYYENSSKPINSNSSLPLDARDFCSDFGDDQRNRYILSDLSLEGNSNMPSNLSMNACYGNFKSSNKYPSDNYGVDPSDTRISYDKLGDERIWSGKNKRTNLNTFGYRLETFNTDNPNNKSHVEKETELLCGTPIHTQKSYGYRNPQEHYFDYIDPQLQHDSTNLYDFMERGGESTRGSNKAPARNYTRGII